MHENADDLSGSALLRCVDGSRDGFVIFLRELHHQLPDAPPPPDQPPPPEKPPPKPPPPIPPPPIPPPQPELQVGPPYGMNIVRPPCLTERPEGAPLALLTRYEITKIISRGNRKATRSLMALEASSERTWTFGCQSAVSPLSTLMMPSTPRSIPPEKSPVLKRGMMALEIITDDNASVRVPSRP